MYERIPKPIPKDRDIGYIEIKSAASAPDIVVCNDNIKKSRSTRRKGRKRGKYDSQLNKYVRKSEIDKHE